MFKNIFLTSGVKRTRNLGFFNYTREYHQANNSAAQIKILFKAASHFEKQQKFPDA